MSSHREAPEISKDPVADSTDTYAFVSTNPGEAGTVTLITNYIPLEDPAGGPNFYEFGDDVLYRINVDNNGDGWPDVTYEFTFPTEIRKRSFLYNNGPIEKLDSDNWNRRQLANVTEVRGIDRTVLGEGLLLPPCNIGPRSTPNYPDLAAAATYDLGDGVRFFAGQRLDGFYVDLGAVFDLGALRPFQNLHLIPLPANPTPANDGFNSLRAFNVHTIAIQVPIERLTADGSVPTDPMAASAVIGVWASAHRQKGQVTDDTGVTRTGPYTQVSRLGNPLVNEVLIPIELKDLWNRTRPSDDAQFNQYVARPELATLLPVLYPGVFPNLAALDADRADLLAILHTGIPAGLIPGFQNNTGTTEADMLRLNVAIPPTATPHINGILGGDLAGFPNGRRVFDNTVAIELRAVAGATYPLVDSSYTPDAAAGGLFDLVDAELPWNVSFLDAFPYLDHPKSGFDVRSLSVAT
jgi:Domain of unknown function (DUF4331)